MTTTGRREFIAGAAAAAVALGTRTTASAAPSSMLPAAQLAQGDAPNILMFCIDDMNDYVGYLGGYGGNAHTPAIDALAAESTRFRKAYCSVPACSGSRATTLWGKSPLVTGVQHDAWAQTPAYDAMMSDPDHLFGLLQAGGYTSFGAGKVFHREQPGAFTNPGPHPDFSTLWGPGGIAGEHGTYFDYGVLDPQETHFDETVADYALARLGEPHATPFILSVGFYQPHVPWRLHQEWFDHHPLAEVVVPTIDPDDLDDEPSTAVELADRPLLGGVGNWDVIDQAGLHAQHVQAYLAALSHTDHWVGRVLDGLASSAYADDTIVVLWSDHGFHLGEKLHVRKKTLWEEATRVPLLVRDLPGGTFPTNTNRWDPVSLIDLTPTLTDLAGLPRSAALDGESLAVVDQRCVRTYWQESESARFGTWRFTAYYDPDDGSPVGASLYNHFDDPDEKTNLVTPAQGLQLATAFDT